MAAGVFLSSCVCLSSLNRVIVIAIDRYARSAGSTYPTHHHQPKHSFATTLPVFMLFYSLFFGVGVGIAYTAPIVAGGWGRCDAIRPTEGEGGYICMAKGRRTNPNPTTPSPPANTGWKWYPDSKGLVSGAVLTGFGAGGFFFNLLGTKLINPDNAKPIGGSFPARVRLWAGGRVDRRRVAYIHTCDGHPRTPDPFHKPHPPHHARHRSPTASAPSSASSPPATWLSPCSAPRSSPRPRRPSRCVVVWPRVAFPFCVGGGCSGCVGFVETQTQPNQPSSRSTARTAQGRPRQVGGQGQGRGPRLRRQRRARVAPLLVDLVRCVGC